MLIDILKDNAFIDEPPVLVDVGASGGAPVAWRKLAQYSIYVGFDADTRDTEFSESQGDGYVKRIVYNRAVIDREDTTVRIRLTKSPHCSSVLPPAIEELKDYYFQDSFRPVREVDVSATRLEDAVNRLGLKRIDILKLDTQGTDLRIFESVGNKLASTILAVEMEPGFIDAYSGEDKAWHVLRAMENRGFWLARLDVRYTVRANADWFARQAAIVRRFPDLFFGRAPGWCNIVLLATPRDEWSYREWLLAIFLADFHGHHGYALNLCDLARQKGLGGAIPAVREQLWRETRWRGFIRSLPHLPRALLGAVKRAILQ